MDKELLAFKTAIEANPRDWDTRKVFADWLEDNGFDDEALEQRNWTEAKQSGIEWLTKFASDNDITYEEAILAGRDLVKYGNRYIPGDGNMSPQEAMDDEETREGFWKHFESATGIEVSEKDKEERAFSCSC